MMDNPDTHQTLTNSTVDKKYLQEIGDLFRLPGTIKKIILLKDGTLAVSYRVIYDTKKSYLFQKMKLSQEDLADTMYNVEKLTDYLKKQDYSLVHFHHTNTRENFIEHNGEFWRVRRFFESYSYQHHTDAASTKELGSLIGAFQCLTRKFDVSKFHKTNLNINNLGVIISNSTDEYVIQNKKQALVVEKAFEEGKIPLRPVHNNSKVKSILLRNRFLYYINLDLATYGICLYDFASVALSSCLSSVDDKEEPELSLEKYSAYLSGFLSTFGYYLTPEEKELIVPSLFAVAVKGVALNSDKEDKRAWFLSLAEDIKNRNEDIVAATAVVIAKTKTKRINLNNSAIERDLKNSKEKKYAHGEYMAISIPHNIKPRGGKIYLFFKRMFDVICSLLAILVLSPLLLIIGLIVVFTSSGPMIYVSQRVGKNGRIFNFYKFRSMYKNAEERLNELLDQNEIEGGVTFKIKNDPRITPFGKFIRKTSIDELPQLFNVLKGDMSLIGPRAALPREIDLYPDEALDRLMVPQGLSGEWQANGRSDTTFDNMIKMDLDYIQNKRSFWHDIALIFKTIIVVITGDGAE